MHNHTRIAFLSLAIAIGLGAAPHAQATMPDDTVFYGTAAAVGAIVTGGLAYLGYCSYENHQAQQARTTLDEMAQEIAYRQRSIELLSTDRLMQLFYNRITDYKNTLSDTRTAIRKIEKMINTAQHYVSKYTHDNTYENRQIAERAHRALPSLHMILKNAQDCEHILVKHEKLVKLSSEVELAAAYKNLSEYSVSAHTARTWYPESQWALIDWYQDLKTRKLSLEQAYQACVHELYLSDRAQTLILQAHSLITQLNILANAIVSLDEYQQQMHYKNAYELEQERLHQERLRVQTALREAEAARQQAENQRKELALEREKLEHKKEKLGHQQRQELAKLRQKLRNIERQLAERTYFADTPFMLEREKIELERRARELQVELYGIFGFWL